MNGAKLVVRPVCPSCGQANTMRFETDTGERHMVCSGCSEAFTVRCEPSGDLVVTTAQPLGRFVSL